MRDKEMRAENTQVRGAMPPDVPDLSQGEGFNLALPLPHVNGTKKLVLGQSS